MKRVLCVFVILATILSFSSCTKTQEKKLVLLPDTTQMKAICELATMQCYYHNVAKYFEEDVEGFGFWKKNRRFWIEYSGIVTVGIDISKLDISIIGHNVTITLPPAEVQNCRVDEDSLTGDYIVIDKKSAEVTYEHQKAACAEAEAKMKMAASNNSSLLESAQKRAKILLEDYIKNIGSIINVNYIINWQYTDEFGNIIKTENAVTTENQSITENTTRQSE